MSFRSTWRNLVRFFPVGITKGLVFTVLFLSLCVVAKTQQLVNPSFEGNRAVATSPIGWLAYGTASSPDTQPGAWRVTQQPSHGNSYISMVCRGYSIYDSYKWESTLQTLVNPLVWGKSYNYSIDLAHSTTFMADTIRFNQPAILRIWGMNEMNQKELLWESEPIANTDWKTVYFSVTPSMRTPYLILEAYYAKSDKYCGNILLDNMQYYPNLDSAFIAEPVVQELIDSTSTDNVTLNANGLPEQIDGRAVEQTQELLFRGNQLTITVWDNRTTDGDVISLYLNDERVLKEFEISKNRLDVTVEVTENKEYYLSLYAHNLGNIPPNTLALYITDGERKKFLTLSSDLKKCEAVKIKVEEELVDRF